ncbi:MAG: polyprenyl synthetase family protein, partial [Burkholderiaceae bacterium]
AIGKNVGDDLREGKPTLPLIYLIQHGTPQQRDLVRACIANGDEAHFDEVLQAITDSGALDYARDLADRTREEAKLSIANFPDNAGKEALLALADFAVERDR